MEAEKQELQVINEPQPSPKNQVTEADTLKQPQDQNPQDGTLPVKKEDKPSAEHYEELKALRESEMWQTAVTVRKLRPENN